MTFKVNQDKLVSYLSSFFPLSRSGAFAIGNVISLYLMLPGLRGFWPMSSIGDAGEAIDLSGQGRTLSLTGTSAYDQGGQSMNTSMFLASSTPRYLSRADEAGFDITGTETIFSGTAKGLTIGCWMVGSSGIPAGANRTVMGKWNSTTNNRSYAIQQNSNEAPMFSISGDGTSVYSILSPQRVSSTTGRWHFVCGVYDLTGGTGEISIYVSQSISLSGHGNNLIKRTLDVGIPASIHSGSAAFTIGAEDGGVNPQVGASIALAFLCVAPVAEQYIQLLYHHSRSMFKQTVS